MKKYLIFLLVIILFGCSKPKTVLICGDHVCINKSEAEQYFEDNLTLEVKILGNNNKESVNLVQLNLESNIESNKKISLFSKNNTNREIKELSKKEVRKKKIELKKRNNLKKRSNSKKIKKVAKLKDKTIKESKTDKKDKKISKNIQDICVLLEKCNIDEISKFLVKQGMNKKYPDITKRENQ